MSLKKIKALALLIVALAVLVGCDPVELIMKPLPQESDKLAREFMYTLRDGDIDTALTLIDSKIKITDKVLDGFKNFSKILNKDELTEIRLVRYANIRAMIGGNERSNFTYELIFEHSWGVANIAVDFMEGERYILGIYMEPLTKPLSEINAFTLKDKSIFHYMALFFTVFFPLVSIFALILCVKTKKHSAMWFWAVFILAGIGNISINWTSGEFSYQIVSISSIWAPAIRDGQSGSYYLSYAIPIGAVVFLYSYFKNRKQRVRVEDLNP